ncbi:hypothetical protein [Methanosarcina horonobensis]|uniref:hypothetical protein n=1 Tax=Methanosarcina horonobensis TaxID=418008 RepID=UPI000AD70B1D|nr:hypothetical protein [Methanosarcina horonobensis]
MEYVTKICPICGNEFIVLKKVEEKAIYCTLKCLLVSQESVKRGAVPSCISA